MSEIIRARRGREGYVHEVHWMAGTRIRSGKSFSTQLKEELLPLPRPILFVFDPVPLRTELVLQELRAQIPDELVVLRDAATPTVEEVNETADQWRHRGVASIVVVGGGSTIDFAKAVTHCMTYPSALSETSTTGLVFNTGWKPPHVPIIAIPTTTGTGSEINGKSVVDFNGKRRLVFHWGMYPQTAILDADLFRTVPHRVVMGGALETLARLVVPVVSASSPVKVSDELAIAQIRTLLEVTSHLACDPKDQQAKHDLAMVNATSVLTVHQLGRSQYSYWLWYLVNELNNHQLSKQQSLELLMPIWARLVQTGELPGKSNLEQLESRLSDLDNMVFPGLVERVQHWTDTPATFDAGGLDAAELTSATWSDWGVGLEQVNIDREHVTRVFTELLDRGSQ